MKWNWFIGGPAPRLNSVMTETVDYLNKKYGEFEYAKDARALDQGGRFELVLSDLIARARADFKIKRVLIAGVNSGEEVKFVRDLDVIGVDLSDRALEILKRNHPEVEAIHANFGCLPLGDKSVDLYICMRSIHASNLDALGALSEAIRVTRGPLIISISNAYNISGHLRRGMYDYSRRRIDPKLPYLFLDSINDRLSAAEYDVSVSEVPSEIIIFGRPKSNRTGDG